MQLAYGIILVQLVVLAVVLRLGLARSVVRHWLITRLTIISAL